jgi:tetratricopeptide (TPR) repeat protein
MFLKDGYLRQEMQTRPNEKEGPDKGAPDALKRYGFFIALAVIIVSAFLIYAKTLSYPFVFDDEFNIVKNLGIRDFQSLWPPSGTRYFSYLSFALNYTFGGLDPGGYRLVNVLIHIINAVLVYRLITLTFRTPAAAHEDRDHGAVPAAVALVAAVIFLAHPIQTGAVTYVTQRFASLATLFYLSSLILFVKWRLGLSSGFKFYFYVPALALAVVAQKTKEISFTLPMVILLYDLLFFGVVGSKGRGENRRLLYLIPFLLTLVIIPLTVLGVFSGYGDGGGAAGGTGGGAAFDAGTRAQQLEDLRTISRHDYLITQFRVIVTYIRLLVLPVNQNLDYDYPLFTSLVNAEVLLSIALLTGILALAAYALRAAMKKKNACLLIASAGVFWFFITLSVESSVIPIKDVIFEHRLYLPSVGACAAFASFVFFVIEKRPWGKKTSSRVLAAAVVILLVTALPFGVAAYKRNHVWGSELTLHQDVVKKSPGNARGHNNLGMAYKDLGMTDKAIEEFRTAIRLIPDQDTRRLDVKTDAGNNLANVYLIRGRLGLAIEAYRAVLKIDPVHVEAHYNLAMACEEYGCLIEAIEHYRRFIELAPPIYSSYKEDARVRIISIRARLRSNAG